MFIKCLSHSQGYIYWIPFTVIFIIIDISKPRNSSPAAIYKINKDSWQGLLGTSHERACASGKFSWDVFIPFTLPFQNQFKSTDLASNQNLFMNNSWMNHLQSSQEKGTVAF